MANFYKFQSLASRLLTLHKFRPSTAAGRQDCSTTLAGRFGYNLSYYSSRGISFQIRSAPPDHTPCTLGNNNIIMDATIQSSTDRSTGGSSPSSSPPTRPIIPKSKPPRVSIWTLAVGSIVSLLLSLWMPKWATVLRIGGQAEVALQEVEQVAQVVEKMAEVAHTASEDLAAQLPDQSKLKEAALLVENVSEEAAKDAQFVEQLIHKVDVVTKDLEGVEELAEPVIKKIIQDREHLQGNNNV